MTPFFGFLYSLGTFDGSFPSLFSVCLSLGATGSSAASACTVTSLTKDLIRPVVRHTYPGADAAVLPASTVPLTPSLVAAIPAPSPALVAPTMPKSVPLAAAPPTAMPALAPPTAMPPAALPAPMDPRMPLTPIPAPIAPAPLIPLTDKLTAPLPTPAPTSRAALAPAAPPASKPCAALDTRPGTTARSGIAFLS